MNLFENILSKAKSGISSYNKAMEGYGANLYDWANKDEQDPIQRFLDDPNKGMEQKQTLMDNLQSGVPKEVLQSYITENHYKPTQFREAIPMAKPFFQATGKENAIVGSAKAVGNIPTSLYNIVAGGINIGNTAIQEGVGETTSMLGKGIVKGVGRGVESVSQAYQQGGALGATSKIIEGAQRAVIEDPTLVFAPNIAKGTSKLIGKGGEAIVKTAEKVAPKVTNAIIKTPQALGKGVTTGAEYTTSLATGLSREAQQTIKSAPKLYKEARLGNITAQGELENFVKATDARLTDLSELGKGYESIKKGNKVASIDDITSAYVKATEGVRDTQLTKADRLVLKDANDYMSQLKGQLDETDVLGLRRQLDSIMYDPNTGLKRKISPTGERVVQNMRAEIDRIAKERIPGLIELDAKYGPEVALLKEVKKQIYDANGNIKPTALSTISNIVGKNKDFKLEQFQKIYPELGARIKALKAFEEVQSLGEIKTGSVVRQGGAIATGSAIAPGVGTIIGWMATNPYIVARVLELYGVAKSRISEILKKGSKISQKEAEIVTKAVKNTPKEKMADIINNLSFDPKTNRLTSGTIGPKKLSTMGKMENAKTPQSIVAGERGYTTAIKKPIVKRASDETLYHGSSSMRELKDFDLDISMEKAKQGSGIGGSFAEGPGIYLTSSKAEASGYGPKVSEFSIKGANIIEKNGTKSLSRQEVSNLLSKIDKDTLQRAIDDWGSKNDLIDNIMEQGNTYEQLMDVWASVFSQQNPKGFVNAVKGIGIDALKVPKEGTTHYVIYNPDKFVSSPKPLSPQKTVKPKNLTKNKESATMGDMETKKLIEEARKYKSAEEFIKSKIQRFHQTSPEYAKNIEKEGFSLKNRENSHGEWLPEGVNTKLTDNELILKNKGTQLKVYIDKNSKVGDFQDRNAVENYIRSHKDGGEFTRIMDERNSFDRKYIKMVDDVDKKLTNNLTKDQIKENLAQQQKIIDEWKVGFEKYSKKAMQEAKKILSKEFDAINIAKDEGGFGKVTDNTIIFDPSKVKTESQLKQIYNKAKTSK